MYFLRVICLLLTVSLIHIDRAVTAAERACGLESAEEWRDIYISHVDQYCFSIHYAQRKQKLL